MNTIKPIRSDADYAAALEEIERAEIDDAVDGDRLEVLVTLVHAYEKATYPIDPPEPIEAILFALDQAQITKKQLETALGGRNRMSEVLARRRGLSLAMIRELNKLGLPLVSLIGEVKLAKAPKARNRTVSVSMKAPVRTKSGTVYRVRVEKASRASHSKRTEKARVRRPRAKSNSSPKS